MAMTKNDQDAIDVELKRLFEAAQKETLAKQHEREVKKKGFRVQLVWLAVFLVGILALVSFNQAMYALEQLTEQQAKDAAQDVAREELASQQAQDRKDLEAAIDAKNDELTQAGLPELPPPDVPAGVSVDIAQAAQLAAALVPVVPGPVGGAGPSGANGADGVDGLPGGTGDQGAPGTSVTSISIISDGGDPPFCSMMVSLSQDNPNTDTDESLPYNISGDNNLCSRGPAGQDGTNGTDGGDGRGIAQGPIFEWHPDENNIDMSCYAVTYYDDGDTFMSLAGDAACPPP